MQKILNISRYGAYTHLHCHTPSDRRSIPVESTLIFQTPGNRPNLNTQYAKKIDCSLKINLISSVHTDLKYVEVNINCNWIIWK